MENHRFVRRRRVIAFLGMTLALVFIARSPVWAQSQTCAEVVTGYATFTACHGTLADGRAYGLEVPTSWNGTLVLLSPGYEIPGTATPTGSSWILGWFDEPDMQWLLGNGSAVAAFYPGSGWALHEAMRNGIETLDIFAARFGPPTRTISYGGSLGGIIAAGLIQRHPERFTGGLLFAAPLAGSIATWNQALDFAFTFKQLVGPRSLLKVIHVTNPGTNEALARQLLFAAQGSSQGRARLALACAMNDIPGWSDPFQPEPAADNYTAQELNQFRWLRDVVIAFMFGFGRADIEARSGGNPSWNTGVNYEAQLEKSIHYHQVLALYAAAGISLEDDLARLKAAPRIDADPAAVEYLSENIVFDGNLGGLPILSLHGEGDGLVVNQHEFAYRSAALRTQNAPLLRQAFVHRAGHVFISPAERIAAFQALFHRIDTGRWEGSVTAEALNASALALGPSYNQFILGGTTYPAVPAYFEYEPAPFLRPYDLALPGGLPSGGQRSPLVFEVMP